MLVQQLETGAETHEVESLELESHEVESQKVESYEWF